MKISLFFLFFIFTLWSAETDMFTFWQAFFLFPIHNNEIQSSPLDRLVGLDLKIPEYFLFSCLHVLNPSHLHSSQCVIVPTQKFRQKPLIKARFELKEAFWHISISFSFFSVILWEKYASNLYPIFIPLQYDFCFDSCLYSHKCYFLYLNYFLFLYLLSTEQ